MLPSVRAYRAADRALGIAAALLAAVLIPLAARPHLSDPLMMFGAFILVTELLDTALPSGRRLSLSLAPGLAFAMLETGSGAEYGAPIVGLTFLIASAMAAGVRAAAGREVRLREIAGSFLTVAAAAAAYDGLSSWGNIHLLSRGGERLASGAGLLAVLCIALFFEPIRATLATAISRDRDALRSPWRSFRETVPLQAAIVSVAALVALAFPKLKEWSFPLFLGPLAATRYAFRQITTIRTTEVQTLRALSKIPEMAGYTQPGHSRRVAELAVAMAAELGMPDVEIRDVEYAALLHDIGRVVLEDPDAERAVHALRRDVAATGSNIVAAAGTFPAVAAMIREQNEPYRRRGEAHNEDVTLGARILKVANTYDDMVGQDTVRRSSWDALEHLHAGKAFDYDPDVVGALTRVLTQARAI